MKLGVVFPPEIGPDPIAVRDFAQAVEGMGFDYILTYEQIIDTPSEDDPAALLEPYTLLSYLAGVTSKLGFATGITVQPTRQTIITAKQIAMLDHLCRGQLRYGVSVGWNPAEFEAAGVDLGSRGARLDEQIDVLRQLWTTPFVTFVGQFHTLNNVGVHPLPVQRPIPIWLGAFADVALKRVARTGDGWISAELSLDDLRAKHGRLQQYIQEAGRNPADVGLELVDIDLGKPDMWDDWLKTATDLNAGYFCVTFRFSDYPRTKFENVLQQFIDAAR